MKIYIIKKIILDKAALTAAINSFNVCCNNRNIKVVAMKLGITSVENSTKCL